MTTDERLFFDPAAQALYACLRAQLLALYPETTLKVQKTQITFLDPRGYAYASRRGRGRLLISFGLGFPLQSPRLLAVANPAPGRYTHHILITDAQQLDSELTEWLAQAHAFMQRPKKRA